MYIYIQCNTHTHTHTHTHMYIYVCVCVCVCVCVYLSPRFYAHTHLPVILRLARGFQAVRGLDVFSHHCILARLCGAEGHEFVGQSRFVFRCRRQLARNLAQLPLALHNKSVDMGKGLALLAEFHL